MTAGEIYRSLSNTGGWIKESRKVRILAARYYADVDDSETLSGHALSHHGDVSPLLTFEQVKMIRDLR